MYLSTYSVEKLEKEKSKYRKYCEYCGHTISFYAFEDDRKICNYCKKYNYRTDKIKFRYLLRKKLGYLR